jgi:arsenate reductase
MEILTSHIQNLKAASTAISPKRKELLLQISKTVQSTIQSEKNAQLLFVCTHNSRRSQFAQIWAAILAEYYELPIQAYSGGTEVTQIHPTVVQVFEKYGLEFSSTTESKNTNYTLHLKRSTLSLFSKLYDAATNPHENFIALMTCSEAADNCPFIPGSRQRFAFSFEDPKIHDGTSTEFSAYENTATEIGRELVCIFEQL